MGAYSHLSVMTSRNAPCNCGSGLRFKNCCGRLLETPLEPETKIWSPQDLYDENGWFSHFAKSDGALDRLTNYPRFTARTASTGSLPPGVIALPNFLSKDICALWCRHIHAQKRSSLGVQDTVHHSNTGEKRTVFHAARITETVDLGNLKNDVLREIIRAYKDVIVPHFQVPLNTIEPPMALSYGAGGRYDCHADSEYWDQQKFCWTRSMDRDLSVLLYLNEEFEGGALYFPNFNLRIRPTTGMMVAFPSDHRYLHAAEPLISGSRTAIVSWAAAKAPQTFDPIDLLNSNLG